MAKTRGFLELVERGLVSLRLIGLMLCLASPIGSGLGWDKLCGWFCWVWLGGVLDVGGCLAYGSVFSLWQTVVGLVGSVADIVRMDRQGRILIPAKIRKRLRSRLFLIEIEDGKIVLKPLESIRLTDLFDSIVVDDVKDFADTHELRKALVREGSGGQVS